MVLGQDFCGDRYPDGCDDSLLSAAQSFQRIPAKKKTSSQALAQKVMNEDSVMKVE